MKLAAIYNVWSDSSDLLEGSVKRIYDLVDVVIFVYQTTSNYGVFDDTCIEHLSKIWGSKVVKINYSPTGNQGFKNELSKRNMGINEAKKQGCTHFLLMDCDEYYDPIEFANAKQIIERNRIDATYCDMWTYFLKPNLRLQIKDNTQVPFICSMKSLPLGGKFGGVYADPTRKVKASPLQINGLTMHHLSWIRKDLRMKLDNSSASPNLNRVMDVINDDIANAESRMYSNFYKSPLEICEAII